MIVMDRKGRIQLPRKVRDLLGLSPGDKFLINTNGDTITLIRCSEPEDLIEVVKKFHKDIQKKSDKPIKFEKLF